MSEGELATCKTKQEKDKENQPSMIGELSSIKGVDKDTLGRAAKNARSLLLGGCPHQSAKEGQ